MRSLPMRVAFLLAICTGIAYGQTQDSYRGFRIGMTLSEMFAVGGGNLEKIEATCAKPPRLLSKNDRALLAKECAKVEQTLAGQPTEWEYKKAQLRLAFDKGNVIRVSDFSGVIHLQKAQPEAAASIPASTPTQTTAALPSTQEATAPQVQLPNQGKDVAESSAHDSVVKPITIQGYTLGAPGHMPDCTEAMKNKFKYSSFSKAEKANWLAECNRGNFDWGNGNGVGGKTKAGKLVSIKMNLYKTSTMDGELFLQDIISKFGEPTRRDDAEMQNAYGAKWTNSLFTWELPNGIITLYTPNGPGNALAGMLKAVTLEENAEESKSMAQKHKNALD